MAIRMWLEPHDTALTAHVNAGVLSFAGMAAAINSEFQTTYSRNATIGRAARLGLSSKRPACVSSAPRPRKQPYTWRARREREAGIIDPPSWAPPTRSSHAFALRCVETVSRDIRFVDLEPNDCRWTDSKGSALDFLFCGNPKFVYCRHDVNVTSSYCRAHFEASIGAGTSPERRASREVAA